MKSKALAASIHRQSSIIALLACTAMVVPTVAAGTSTWTGNGIVSNTGLWSDPANWTGGVPTNGSDVVFPATAVYPVDYGHLQNDLNGLVLNSLTFNSNGTGWSDCWTGKTLTLGTGAVGSGNITTTAGAGIDCGIIVVAPADNQITYNIGSGGFGMLYSGAVMSGGGPNLVIHKTGPGLLRLDYAKVNADFDLQQGSMILGLSSTSVRSVTVAPGAQLQTGNYPFFNITVSGSGVDGQGGLINASGNNVKFVGDTTIGLSIGGNTFQSLTDDGTPHTITFQPLPGYAQSRTETVAKGGNLSGNVVIQSVVFFADNASGSATGTAAVHVTSGGVLSGKGTITGPVTVDSGCTIMPYVTNPTIYEPMHTLHLSSLTWNGGVNVNLPTNIYGDINQLVLDGALTKGDAGIYDILISYGYYGSKPTLGRHTLMTFDSTDFSISDFVIDPKSMLFQGHLEFGASGKELDLVVTSVDIPEPATLGLLVCGAMGLMLRRARR